MQGKITMQIRHLSILTLLAFSVSSCKNRPSVESGVRKSSSESALGMNDVSILFPVFIQKPGSTAEQSQEFMPTELLTLDTKNSSGKALLSKVDFEDILSRSKGTLPNGEKINSGIVYSQKPNPNAQEGSVLDALDAGKYEQWRIVALRYDPCAPIQRTEPRLPHPPPNSFKPEQCEVQLRLTAQPVVLEGQKIIAIGDFAMHLLYELSEAEGRSIAASLLDFKNGCGPKYDGALLGVNPCLKDEVLSGQRAAHNKIASIVKNGAKNISAAAFMGTRASKDPWAFFNVFKGPDGKFIHLPVAAVHDPKAGTTVDKNGRTVRLSFGNGMHQMLSFRMSISNRASESNESDLTTDNLDDGKKDVVVPLPQPGIENLSLALRTDFQLTLEAIVRNRSREGLEKTIDPIVDELLRTAHRIENPTKNDFFSVDCVGCHTATQAISSIKEDGLQLFSSETNSKTGLPARTVPDEKLMSMFALESQYSPKNGIIAGVVPAELQRTRYNVINFGYFGNRPSVSRRTAFETAGVVAMVNEMNGTPVVPFSGKCEAEKVTQCLEIYGNGALFNGTMRLTTEAGNELAERHCYKKYCQSALKPPKLRHWVLQAKAETTLKYNYFASFSSQSSVSCTVKANQQISVVDLGAANGEDLPLAQRIAGEKATSPAYVVLLDAIPECFEFDLALNTELELTEPTKFNVLASPN